MVAPRHLAAEWDNVGLLIGDAQAVLPPAGRAAAKSSRAEGRLLLCIDLTEEVLAEAQAAKAGMVMAYHPPIFKPIARVTAGEAPVVYAAARLGLAVYSVHTAFDAVPGGVNDVLADLLGMTDRRPLEPIQRQGQCKIVAFLPPDDLSRVAEAAFSAGAGRIGRYYDCAFFSHGIGAFCGGLGSHPSVGAVGRHEVTEEMRLEIVAPRSAAAAVCRAVRAVHSYEEPAIDVYPLLDVPAGCGLGRIGRLRRPASASALIARIKKATGQKRLLVAPATGPGAKKAEPVTTAACCAGSCGKLFREAVDGGAKLYLTGEMRHHEALAAAGAGMTVVCLGHSNSERIALQSLALHLRRAAPKLDVVVSRRDRDPFEIV
jgi:dinuclear metal center YbgI/SA1388 family protein